MKFNVFFGKRFYYMKSIIMKPNLVLFLNIVAASYLIYAMPQQILIDHSTERLKILSVVCVDICAALIFICSAYRIIFRLIFGK